jgi:hypothetical protein
MRSTLDLLDELFSACLTALAEEHGLTPAERERILTVFQQAAANPFMTEQHIHQKLTAEDDPPCS